MFCSFCALREKEVVGICDGKRYGCVQDLEFDLCCGKIVAILVPGGESGFHFGKKSFIRIPYDRIEKIGDDIILVSYSPPPSPPRDGCKTC